VKIFNRSETKITIVLVYPRTTEYNLIKSYKDIIVLVKSNKVSGDILPHNINNELSIAFFSSQVYFILWLKSPNRLELLVQFNQISSLSYLCAL
jgi:hypothetical protein